MFMKKIILLMLSFASAFMSCEKIEKVTVPDDFDVLLEKDTYAAGDTVRFIFQGNPDVISFYSGEVGNDYDYTAGRVARPDFFLNFEEQCIDGDQDNQLKVYVSKDFNEDYSLDGIHSEDVHWIDISERFDLLGPGKVTNNRNYTDVGNASLNDILENEDTKLYFAFNYTADPYDLNREGTNIIRARNIRVFSEFDHNETDLLDWNDFNWQLITKFEQDPTRPSEIQENNKVIQFRCGWGNKPDGSGTWQSDGADNWAVSAPVVITRTVDMGPDHAVGIKGMNDVQKTSHEYVYEYPGTYDAVFVARNVNINGAEEKIIRLKITIHEKV